MDQRGQVLPLVALLAVAVGGLLLGIARFGAHVTDAARAQAAADAAALAAVAEDRGAAEDLAAENGGAVVSYDPDGRDVELRAEVGDVWAVARARRVGGGQGVIGWVGEDGIGGAARRASPLLRTLLERAASALHQPVPLTAVSGRAVDVPRTFAARLAAVSARTGLCRPAPRTHPVRFAPCPAPPT